MVWRFQNIKQSVFMQDTLRLAGLDAGAIAATEQAAVDEMRAVLAVARDTPFPPAENAFTDVQDIGSPQQEAY